MPWWVFTDYEFPSFITACTHSIVEVSPIWLRWGTPCGPPLPPDPHLAPDPTYLPHLAPWLSIWSLLSCLSIWFPLPLVPCLVPWPPIWLLLPLSGSYYPAPPTTICPLFGSASLGSHLVLPDWDVCFDVCFSLTSHGFNLTSRAPPPHKNNIFHFTWKNSQNSHKAIPFPPIRRLYESPKRI